ncbi:MAG: DVU0298 family protein [Syntrophales bacterium]
MEARNRIITILSREPLAAVLEEVRTLPPRRALTPLIAALCRPDERVKWHAVSCLGAVTAELADGNIESARTVMRRLMWSLNDESGGVGWGSPEALAEIMANHAGLAAEYAYFLTACMRGDGFTLELPALRRGLMWGIGRLAAVRPALLRTGEAPILLLAYLASEDPEVRGLAARAAGLLGIDAAKGRIARLQDDPAQLRLYEQGEFHTATVGKLATEALRHLA